MLATADVPSLRLDVSTPSSLKQPLEALQVALSQPSGFTAPGDQLAVCIVKAEGSVTLLSDLDFQATLEPSWTTATEGWEGELVVRCGARRDGCGVAPTRGTCVCRCAACARASTPSARIRSA